MSEQICCPDCQGNGRKDGFVNGGPDISKHYYGSIRCIRCRGSGLVPADMIQWIERGKELAARRREVGFTLLTGSELLNLETSTLSAIETGRIQAPEGSENWWQNKD